MDDDALRRAIAQEHLLFMEARRHEQRAERWQRRADLALRQGDEPLASQALQRKAAELERAALYRAQFEAQGKAVQAAKPALGRPSPAGSTTPLPMPPRAAGAEIIDRRLDQLAREDRLDRDLAALKEQLTGR